MTEPATLPAAIERRLGEYFPTTFRVYVRKWIPLSVLIGVLVGLLTAVFYATILGMMWVFDPQRIPWYLVFLFPTAGGLLVGLILPRFTKQPMNQGMDEVLRAIHYQGGEVRSVSPAVKIAAASLTLGSGGSAGPEGPVGEIGAKVASMIGDRLKLHRSDLRTLVITGVAAGFSAIFKAPLGGALFALESPYKNDLEHSAVVPSLVSAVTSYLVFVVVGQLTGLWNANPVFGPLPHPNPLFGPLDLGLYLVLGLVAGLPAVFFVRVFSQVSDHFEGAKLPFVAKATLGGLACGLVALAFPAFLGVPFPLLGLGYTWDNTLVKENLVQLFLINQGLGGVEALAALLVVVAVAKIVATSFTIGSGGNGGILTPSVFIGGTLGAFFALVAGAVTAVPSPEVFVVVGMRAVLAATTKTPIVSAVLITEMTGGWDVLIPVILATVVSFLVSGEYTLYRAQITRKSMLVDLSVLKDKQVRDVMTPAPAGFPPSTKIDQAYHEVEAAPHYAYPIVDHGGKLLGIVMHRSLEAAHAKRPNAPLARLMQAEYEVIDQHAMAVDAFEDMTGRQITRMWVVDGGGRLVGILTRVDLMRVMDEPAAARTPPRQSS